MRCNAPCLRHSSFDLDITSLGLHQRKGEVIGVFAQLYREGRGDVGPVLLARLTYKDTPMFAAERIQRGYVLSSRLHIHFPYKARSVSVILSCHAG